MIIKLSDEGLYFDHEQVTLPTSIERLIQILDPPSRTMKTKHNSQWIWDELGIKAFMMPKESEIGEIEIDLFKQTYAHSPQKPFTGTIEFKGQDIRVYYRANRQERVKLFKGDDSGALVAAGLSAWFSVMDKEIEAICFSPYQDKKTDHTDLLPLDAEYVHYTPLWQSWISAVTQFVSENNTYYDLKPGITEAAIQQAQAKLPVSLPSTLVNFYKVHDVDYNAVTSAFSIHINGFDYDLLPFHHIAREWQQIDDLQFGDGIERENLAGFDRRVKSSDYANPNWIPFAEGRNGDYLLIDTDPSEQGVYGQVIELVNEDWTRKVVADSLTQLIEHEIVYIQDNGKEKYQFILERD